MSTQKFDGSRFLYAGFTALLFILAFLGFKYFYLHGQAYPGRPLTPPIRTLVITHGVAMSVWMILLIAQSLLITGRQYRIHMFLGKAGAALAAVLVYLGVRVAVEATRVNPPDFELWGLVPREFLAVSLSAILFFGIFVAIGIWYRRRPAIHKPMIFLGTLSATGAAIDRIGPLKNLYEHTLPGRIWGPYLPLLVIGALFLVLKGALSRQLDRPFLAGCAVLALAGAATMFAAATPVWAAVADYLLR